MNSVENKTIPSVAVTAIVVTYNSDDTISANLEALAESYQAGILKVIVVDNMSQDNTVTLIRRDYPWVQLIGSGANLGYGRGLNVGLKETTTPYVLFMNPDAILPLQGVSTLVAFMNDHPEAGLTAPCIIRRNGAYQEAGGIPTPLTILKTAAGINSSIGFRRTINPGEAPFETDWICGAIMLGRTMEIKKIHGFDPRFFLYFEETDLCMRIRKSNAQIWAVGEAIANHASNSSARKIDPELETGGCLLDPYYRSRFYFLSKHYGLFTAYYVELAELFLLGLYDLVKSLVKRKTSTTLKDRLKAPVMKFPEQVAGEEY